MGAGLFGNKKKKDNKIAADPNSNNNSPDRPEGKNGGDSRAQSPRSPDPNSPDPQRRDAGNTSKLNQSQAHPWPPRQPGQGNQSEKPAKPGREQAPENPNKEDRPGKADKPDKQQKADRGGGDQPKKAGGPKSEAKRGPCPAPQELWSEKVYFDEKELKRLRKKYDRADTDKSGTMKLEEFGNMPELISHSFRERILNLTEDKLKSQGKQTISFEDFTKFLSIFHYKCPEEMKMKYLFRLYDIDGDNFIDEKDLITMMKYIFFIEEIKEQDGVEALETLLTNEEFVVNMVKDIITKFDDNNDMKIEYSEFVHMIFEGDLETRMNITF